MAGREGSTRLDRLNTVASIPAAFASPQGVNPAFQAMASMAFQTLSWLSISSFHPAAEVEGAEPALEVVNVRLRKLRSAMSDAVMEAIAIPSHSVVIIS